MKSKKLVLLLFFWVSMLLNIYPQVDNSVKTEGYNLHRVTKQQTLFRLSKEFNVSVDEIKNANGGLPDGLQEGMLIRIPIKRNINTANDEPANFVKQEKQEKQSFFEYQAREKELVYPLAIRYQVSVDSIFALNPGISETLESNQIIKIPVVKNTTGFVTHRVKHNQPLSKLAKSYNLSVDEIIAINPYLSKDIKADQVVRIPVMKMDSDNPIAVDLLPVAVEPPKVEEPEIATVQDDLCTKCYNGEIFRIALMLPLYFNLIDSLSIQNTEGETNLPKVSYLKSFTFIQFYEGFLMAVDSLKNRGLHCELYVFNVDDDVFETKKVLANPQLKNMDLIVGPVFARSFNVVAGFARENQINIVNPFSTRNEILYNNPYVFKMKPSSDYQYKTLADFLNISFKEAQIFVVRQNQYRDEVEFGKLKSILDQKLVSQNYELYHEITYGNDSLVPFLQQASFHKQNLVIIYSENKAFIFDMLRKLNEIRDRYQITVIGLPNWKKIEDIEIEHIINLNTHFITPDHINYDSPGVKSFIKNFREKYSIEPLQYAFEGFDTGYFFISALMKFGNSHKKCIHNFEYNGMQSDFLFERTANNGFTNTRWKILKVADYRYEDVTPPGID